MKKKDLDFFNWTEIELNKEREKERESGWMRPEVNIATDEEKEGREEKIKKK